MTDDMNEIAKGLVTDVGVVSGKEAGKRRYPIVFLIDVSGSTGIGNDPDINHINRFLSKMIDLLRSPPANHPLSKTNTTVDTLIMAYSENIIPVLDWSVSSNLPTVVPPLTPLMGTRTGFAFKQAFQKIKQRYDYYNATGLPYGLAHVIHLTDGEITDMKPGDPLWTDVSNQIARITGSEDNKTGIILNFISPRGLGKTITGMTGLEALGALSGNESVFNLNSQGDAFENLLKFITKTIVNITNAYGTKFSVEEALADNPGVSPSPLATGKTIT